jgi:hypothetical protein
MTQSVLFRLRSAFYFGLLLAACGEDTTPVGTLDATLIDPTSAGEAYSLVRATGDYEIQDMAISDDYVFFGTLFQGIYRSSKYGGELDAFEPDGDNAALAASRDRLFWTHPRSDISLQLRTRAAAGGATSVLIDQHWPNGFAGHSHFMLADAQHVYLAAVDSVVAIPVDGGEAISVPLTESNPAERDARSYSWVPDAPALYASNCGFSDQPCPLMQGDLLTGTTRPVAELHPGQAVVAVDETSLYLQDQHRIWRTSKTDFSSTSIFESSSPTDSVQELQVDDTDVYFITVGQAGWQLRAVPKSGGPSRVIGSGAQLSRGVWRMLQDEQFIFILAGADRAVDGSLFSNELLVFPKAVAGDGTGEVVAGAVD